jgi:hypothetical protein
MVDDWQEWSKRLGFSLPSLCPNVAAGGSEGQPANALTYLGTFQFGITADASRRFTFFRDSAGMMEKMTLQGGVTMAGTRTP